MQALTIAQPLGSSVAFSTSSRPTTKTSRQVSARRQVSIVAMAAPPKGVTQPPRQPTTPPPMFGFVDNAERLNSRAAMIGWIALLIIEAVTNKGILEVFGFSTGGGLDIGL